MSSSKLKNLSDLDQLVSDYLLFRKHHDTGSESGSSAVVKKDSSSIFPDNPEDSKDTKHFSVSDKILAAFDDGDYAFLLSLWETFIVQPSFESLSPTLSYEFKAAEFLCNLHCAVFPFRSEIIRRLGAPDKAAKAAARSMTIFKHFYESRGSILALKGSEFYNFRGLHRIAFPPTHPQCKELFLQAWVPSVRLRIETFLKNYLNSSDPSIKSKDMPVLYNLFFDSISNGEHSSPNTGRKSFTKQPSVVVSVLKNREEKLVRFSQAIIDITSDLLGAVEKGDVLDPVFLANFKEKFDFFRDALPVVVPVENLLSLGASFSAVKDGPDGDDISNSSRSRVSTGGSVNSKRPKKRSHSKSKPLKDEERQESIQFKNELEKRESVDLSLLNFDEIVLDLHSKVHEVENFLIESLTLSSSHNNDHNTDTDNDTTSDNHSVSSDNNGDIYSIEPIVEPKQPAKIKYAITAAMRASVLAYNLTEIVIRPNSTTTSDENSNSNNTSSGPNSNPNSNTNKKQLWPATSDKERDVAVTALVICDILGIVSSAGRIVEEDSTDPLFSLTPTLRNEGIVGFIESLKLYLSDQMQSESISTPISSIQKDDSFFLRNKDSKESKEKLGRHSFKAHTTPQSPVSTKNNDSTYQKNKDSEKKGKNFLQGSQDLVKAIQCLAESLFRLVAAIGSSPSGSQYLTSYGSELTYHTSRLLILLPTNFQLNSLIEKESDSNALTATQESISSLDSGEKSNLISQARQVDTASYSMRLWCILTLVVLESDKNELIKGKKKNKKNHDEITMIEKIIKEKNDSQELIKWLKETLLSMLQSILSAAFALNSEVSSFRDKEKGDSIAAAALYLDMNLLSAYREKQVLSSDNTCGLNLGLIEGCGELKYPLALVAGDHSVSQEMLLLVDLCVSLLVITCAKSSSSSSSGGSSSSSGNGHHILAGSQLKKTTLEEFFTRLEGENIILMLNTLFRDEVKNNLFKKSYKVAFVKKTDSLTWFPDYSPLLELLLILVSDSDSVCSNDSMNTKHSPDSKKNTYPNPNPHDSGYTLMNSIFNNLMQIQIHAVDNPRLLEYCSGQKNSANFKDLLKKYESSSKAKPQANSSPKTSPTPTPKPNSNRKLQEKEEEAPRAVARREKEEEVKIAGKEKEERGKIEKEEERVKKEREKKEIEEKKKGEKEKEEKDRVKKDRVKREKEEKEEKEREEKEREGKEREEKEKEEKRAAALVKMKKKRKEDEERKIAAKKEKEKREKEEKEEKAKELAEVAKKEKEKLEKEMKEEEKEEEMRIAEVEMKKKDEEELRIVAIAKKEKEDEVIRIAATAVKKKVEKKGIEEKEKEKKEWEEKEKKEREEKEMEKKEGEEKEMEEKKLKEEEIKRIATSKREKEEKEEEEIMIVAADKKKKEKIEEEERKRVAIEKEEKGALILKEKQKKEVEERKRVAIEEEEKGALISKEKEKKEEEERKRVAIVEEEKAALISKEEKKKEEEERKRVVIEEEEKAVLIFEKEEAERIAEIAKEEKEVRVKEKEIRPNLEEQLRVKHHEEQRVKQEDEVGIKENEEDRVKKVEELRVKYEEEKAQKEEKDTKLAAIAMEEKVKEKEEMRLAAIATKQKEQKEEEEEKAKEEEKLAEIKKEEEIKVEKEEEERKRIAIEEEEKSKEKKKKEEEERKRVAIEEEEKAALEVKARKEEEKLAEIRVQNELEVRVKEAERLGIKKEEEMKLAAIAMEDKTKGEEEMRLAAIAIETKTKIEEERLAGIKEEEIKMRREEEVKVTVIAMKEKEKEEKEKVEEEKVEKEKEAKEKEKREREEKEKKKKEQEEAGVVAIAKEREDKITEQEQEIVPKTEQELAEIAAIAQKEADFKMEATLKDKKAKAMKSQEDRLAAITKREQENKMMEDMIKQQEDETAARKH